MTREKELEEYYEFIKDEPRALEQLLYRATDIIKATRYDVEDDFQSRICTSCKYFEVHNESKQSGYCNNEESIGYTSKEAIYGGDGCNQWESKDG